MLLHSITTMKNVNKLKDMDIIDSFSDFIVPRHLLISM